MLAPHEPGDSPSDLGVGHAAQGPVPEVHVLLSLDDDATQRQGERVSAELMVGPIDSSTRHLPISATKGRC